MELTPNILIKFWQRNSIMTVLATEWPKFILKNLSKLVQTCSTSDSNARPLHSTKLLFFVYLIPKFVPIRDGFYCLKVKNLFPASFDWIFLSKAVSSLQLDATFV